MTAKFRIGFPDSWTGIFVEGEQKFFVKDRADAVSTQFRWERHLKDKYGENAFCFYYDLED